MSEIILTDTLSSTVAGGSPAVQALTMAYARLQIRSYGTVEDTLLATFIDAAASYFAEQTGRPCLTETRVAGLSAFPFVGSSGSAARIELPHPPLQRVRTVEYIDANGTLQSFVGGSPSAALWRAVTYAGDYAVRGSVEPLYGGTWPIARCETDAVRITYDCGYANTAADVPALVQGILGYLVGQFDTYRAASEETVRGQVIEVPYGVRMLLDGFKYTARSSQVLRDVAVPSGTLWSVPWR
jgi:uncharacterized phiE125 gp8 family phage protein